MDDLISRQALMKEFSDFVRESNNSDFAPTPIWNDAVSLVASMPSAERRGRWLMTDAYPHKVYCSECYATLIPNVEWFKTYNIASNYCPNCGARMEGEQNG